MKPSITEQDFDVLVAQTGLPLSDEQKRDIFSVYGHLETWVARVHAPLPREIEPSHIFKPGAK